MWDKVQETVQFLKKNDFDRPDFAIILGSGLGAFTEKMHNKKVLEYSNIPHFSVSTVQGHKGRLVFGLIGDKKVLALQGRFHYYEGYSMKQVTFPIRVIKSLGADKLIVSNASGGVNPTFKVGDIMLIKDHINLLPQHPLNGPNDSRFGPRFVDMHQAYNLPMRQKIQTLANIQGLDLKEGVYLGLEGPTFETPAEYNMVRILGADAVGMSTVPEVIVARHMDMEVLGLSVITDLGIAGKVEPVSHKAVQEAAKTAEIQLSSLVEAFILSKDI